MGNKSKRRNPKRNPQEAIGYPHRRELSSFFHTSLIGLLQHEWNRVSTVIAVLSGPKVDAARNTIFRRWLENTDAEHMLMLDTDMVIPPHALDRLIKHDKDIVGGLAFTGAADLQSITPTIRVVNQDDPDNPLDVLWEYPSNSLIQVVATGGACMLIKREVAEVMWEARGKDHPLPWFAHGMHNGVEIGEDVAFCLTAGKIGYEVWVDTGLLFPHEKSRFLGEEEYALSLARDDHPHHDLAEKVPIYQELFNGHTD